MKSLVEFPFRRRPRRPTREPRDTVQRLGDGMLATLGAHSHFVDVVLGDLAEEYAERIEGSGVRAAQWWYVREAIRSTPHVLAHSARHGSPDAKRALAAVAASILLVPCIALALLAMRDGPPARLVLSGGSDDGLVVHNTRPVQLPVRVLDESDTELPADSVRFGWLSGAPVSVSPTGVLTCTERGDAVVQASLTHTATQRTTQINPRLTTQFTVRCRPVTSVRLVSWNDMVVGDPPRAVPARIEGIDGGPEVLRAARLTTADSTVATLEGLRIRPIGPGLTHVVLYVGDVSWPSVIRVFAPVRTLDGLREDQRHVAAPIRLAPGDTIRWPLPAGSFTLVFLHDSDNDDDNASSDPSVRSSERSITDAMAYAPVVDFTGPVRCTQYQGTRANNLGCEASDSTGTILIMHPGVGAAGSSGNIIRGRLAIERYEETGLPRISGRRPAK